VWSTGRGRASTGLVVPSMRDVEERRLERFRQISSRLDTQNSDNLIQQWLQLRVDSRLVVVRGARSRARQSLMRWRRQGGYCSVEIIDRPKGQ
jgi:hypothetical protein